MTPNQAAILFNHIKIITQGRISPPKELPTKITIEDFAQGEAEAIYQFLAQVHKFSSPPEILINPKGVYLFKVDLPEEFKLDDSRKPEELLAGYTTHLEKFREDDEELAQDILTKIRGLFPAHLHDTFPLERLIKWDEKLQYFSAPLENILQWLLKKIGINKMMSWISRDSKLGVTGFIAKYFAVKPLSEIRDLMTLTNAQPLTPAELDDLGEYIQGGIQRALPGIKENCFPTGKPIDHELLYEYYLAEAMNPRFDSIIQVDLDEFSKKLDILNESIYGKLEDYRKQVTAGSTPIGLCEVRGKRPTQEDYLAYDHDKVASFPQLRPYDQWHALTQAVDRIKEQFGQRTTMGTTLCSVIAWEKNQEEKESRRINLVTTNIGDSSALVVIIDPIANRIKFVRRLNNLHNPDKNINPAEKNRVDAFCIANNIPPSQNGCLSGRTGSRLAMSRSLGDSHHDVGGHITTPEIKFTEIELGKEDQVFVAVTCDGIFEPGCLTLDSFAQLILQNYQTASLEQLASMVVDKAILADSWDNCSVAITKLGSEAISLSILDGHGSSPASHILAHDGGRMFYPQLNEAIEAALTKQRNPQEPGWVISVRPCANNPESKTDFPPPNVTWNMKVLTQAHPSFPRPQGEYLIQVAEANMGKFYSCRLPSFEEALSFFEFLTHLSCVTTNLNIAHNRALDKYVILLNKKDYSLLAPHMYQVKPRQDHKSKNLIQPGLLVPQSIFGEDKGVEKNDSKQAHAVVPDASTARDPGSRVLGQ